VNTIQTSIEEEERMARSRSKSNKPKPMKTVQSGIEISGLERQSGQSGKKESFITSRFARVLLAGAGFLADAVIQLHLFFISIYF
jgi:hypothetical protein